MADDKTGELPILFKGEMVRAILSDRNTQTRRMGDRWAKVQPGDRLWVKETFHTSGHFDCLYRADFSDESRLNKVRSHGGWRSPIFMPRRLSRLTLEVVEVRAQHLQDISEEDAKAEGCKPSDAAYVHQDGTGRHREMEMTARGAFACLWDSINGKRAPWASNPMVTAITFRRVAP